MAWLVHPQIHAKGRDHPYLSGAQTQAGKGGSPSMLAGGRGGRPGQEPAHGAGEDSPGGWGRPGRNAGGAVSAGGGGPFEAVREEGRRACSPTYPSPAQTAGVSDPGHLGPSRRGWEALGSASGRQSARARAPCSLTASAGVRLR